MARIDTLGNFLTDVATAIKNKTGKTEPIKPTNFDAEIASIESGGSSGKYAPRYIRFTSYSGEDLDYELSNLDFSSLTSLAAIFSSCKNLKTVTVPSGNCPNVQNMNSMFSNCTNLETIVFSELTVPNVTTLNSIFDSCTNLKTVDMYGLKFNGSVDTSFKSMFAGRSNLTSVILPQNCASIKDMSYMFENCTGLTNLKLKGNPTKSGKNFEYMFSKCSNLTHLDLSEFTVNVYGAQNVVGMFASCTSLQHLDVSGITFNTISGSFITNMLNGVPTTCEIIVKNDTDKSWFNSNFSKYTNVKTKAEV